MHDEAGFLAAIGANPRDDVSRLVYADWLDERGDDRGQLVRLHLALLTLAPDHPHRVAGEQEYSLIRKHCEAEWFAVIEGARSEGDSSGRWCQCFESADT